MSIHIQDKKLFSTLTATCFTNNKYRALMWFDKIKSAQSDHYFEYTLYTHTSTTWDLSDILVNRARLWNENCGLKLPG